MAKKKYTNKNLQSSVNETLFSRNETLFGPKGKRFYKAREVNMGSKKLYKGGVCPTETADSTDIMKEKTALFMNFLQSNAMDVIKDKVSGIMKKGGGSKVVYKYFNGGNGPDDPPKGTREEQILAMSNPFAGNMFPQPDLTNGDPVNPANFEVDPRGYYSPFATFGPAQYGPFPQPERDWGNFPTQKDTSGPPYNDDPYFMHDDSSDPILGAGAQGAGSKAQGAGSAPNGQMTPGDETQQTKAIAASGRNRDPLAAYQIMAGLQGAAYLFNGDERARAEKQQQKFSDVNYWSTTVGPGDKGDYLVDTYAGQHFRPNATGAKVSPWGNNFSYGQIGSPYYGMAKGGENPRGEIREMDEAEIQQFLAQGGTLEYLD